MKAFQMNNRILSAYPAFSLLALGLFMAGCTTYQKAVPEDDFSSSLFPWVSHEAESGTFQGQRHGPSRKYLTPGAEASGNSYVSLKNKGDYVEVTATRPANTIVVRACIPDAPEGRGMKATLSLYRNDEFLKKLELSSRHAWIYGRFPWFNHPDHGKPHRFFDESHSFITPVAAGDTLRLQIDEGDNADYYLVDLIELELAPPPLQQPAESLSILEHGAIPDDGLDDAPAFLTTTEQAQTDGRTVWIPEGTYQLNGGPISLGNITIQGAGMWHTRLMGPAVLFRGKGEAFRMSDLAIFGDIDQRFDETFDNAFTGNMGDGTVLERLWIEHTKCGIWSTPGTKNLQVLNCRIRNTMADGINFADSSSYCRAEGSHFRNTGDDALATWSPTESWASGIACSNNVFINNRVELPWLANGIAIYGGSNHRIEGNTIIGNVYAGSGITISSGHGAAPFGGTIAILSNRLIRTGSESYFDSSTGGFWLYAPERDIDAVIRVEDLSITQTYDAAIAIQGPKKISQAEIRDVRMSDVKGPGLHVLPDAQGMLRLINLESDGSPTPLLKNENETGFLFQSE